MIEHSHELHYWSIWFVQLQRYSDCHLQIVERKTLYFLHHWWWKYHSRKDSWNVASMSISNSWFIKLHCIQLRFSVHLHSLKVSLQISLWLFIIYHSQIDNQSERVNQNIKRYLWFFCSYMQNDWFKWLSMIEFIDNNVLSSIIFLILFFMNKSFHSCMSFDSDIIKYESIRKRLQID